MARIPSRASFSTLSVIPALRSASDAPISLEILPVAAHFRRGRYVAPHLHLNLTYLLIAQEEQALRPRPDENSGVSWFAPEEAVAASTEPDMRVIYEKLNSRRMKGK